MFESADTDGVSESSTPSPFGIFVSYRRVDSSAWVGRLVENLRARFGHDRVYRDMDSNRSAQDFVRQIDEALSSADAVVAVIGKQWLHSGQRGLHQSDDFVRLELETALKRGLLLVPVVVDGATMPSERELPESLRSIAGLQSVEMTDRYWEHDFHQLLHTLDNHGVLPYPGQGIDDRNTLKDQLTGVRRFERTLPAPPNRIFTLLLSAVQQLRYPQVKVDREAAEVIFTVIGREVRAVVVDARPGQSTLVVSFTSVKSRVFAAGAAVALATNPLLGLTWPAVRAWERRFAAGFIENVERLLQGRGIGEDSALPPGVQSWRKRRWKV